MTRPATPRRARAATALVAGLALAAPCVAPHAHADLRGPRDVARAIEALDDERDERREVGARWLGAHGPDELVARALLVALETEEELAPMVPIALALARRARPEDAPRLLALEPRLRSAGRVAIVVTLAQLGTEESDAWLVSRLASPAGVELRPAIEQAAEIARQRRDAVLPRVLDAIADHEAPLLVSWLASLADERARGALVAIALHEGPSRAAALEGLARLGPDAETARRLGEPAMLAEMLRAATDLASAYVRALLAADPAADVAPFLADTLPELRTIAIDTLVEHAPERALAVLGSDLAALAPADRHALTTALRHPSLPLAPWLEAALADPTLEARTRSEALEALVRVPSCGTTLEAASSGELALEEAALADARLARACPLRPLRAEDDDRLVALHLAAIAGRDVRETIAARFVGAASEDRLLLAHAWLSSREPDARVLDALEGEADPEVYAVLALAAISHGIGAAGARTSERLEHPSTRLAALDLALASRVAPSPRALRAAEEALGGPDDASSALALRTLARHRPRTTTAFACAALESGGPMRTRAARHVLLDNAARPECVRWRARVDPELRALLAAPRSEPSSDPLVVRVTSNVGGALLRVSIETLDGRTIRLRPPRDGIVVVPGLGPADVQLRLDAEAGDR
jgi:hypothetical protein